MRDKVIGKKWIYLERIYKMWALSEGSILKQGMAGFYGLGNSIGY